jgi:hypothetical protein
MLQCSYRLLVQPQQLQRSIQIVDPDRCQVSHSTVQQWAPDIETQVVKDAFGSLHQPAELGPGLWGLEWRWSAADLERGPAGDTAVGAVGLRLSCTSIL